jgi:hypothetical protein
MPGPYPWLSASCFVTLIWSPLSSIRNGNPLAGYVISK